MSVLPGDIASSCHICLAREFFDRRRLAFQPLINVEELSGLVASDINRPHIFFFLFCVYGKFKSVHRTRAVSGEKWYNGLLVEDTWKLCTNLEILNIYIYFFELLKFGWKMLISNYCETFVKFESELWSLSFCELLIKKRIFLQTKSESICISRFFNYICKNVKMLFKHPLWSYFILRIIVLYCY